MSPSDSKKKRSLVTGNQTIRVAGDAGDGMQLVGRLLAKASTLAGNDIVTFPDFPVDIYPPRGTREGVSSFQIRRSTEEVLTAGSKLDILATMTPAALVLHQNDLRYGGMLIVDSDEFNERALKRACLDENPLTDGTLEAFKVIQIPMQSLVLRAVESLDLTKRMTMRTRGYFLLGFLCWICELELTPILSWLEQRFKQSPHFAKIAEGNRIVLRAGWNFGETTQQIQSSFNVPTAEMSPGVYRDIFGTQAISWGLLTAAKLSDRKLFFAMHPRVAGDYLHILEQLKQYGVLAVQADDEISGACSVIGAAFGGSLGATVSDGPGMALMSESLGLGMMMELPFIVIDVQRSGPSYGMPTKTEQSDLMMAMFGRNGESPIPVVAVSSPSDGFRVAIDAWRIAVKFMTPVIILTNVTIANSTEPWKIVDVNSLEKIEIEYPIFDDEVRFLPYSRNQFLARPWVTPGTPNLMHRVGGLEKEHNSGNVSYAPENHQKMVDLRRRKVELIANEIDQLEINGPDNGLLVLSWGSTYGVCATAVERLQTRLQLVAHSHLRWINPFPSNIDKILSQFDKVLIPELNNGQLCRLIQARTSIQCQSFNKTKGKPFTLDEITDWIVSHIEE